MQVVDEEHGSRHLLDDGDDFRKLFGECALVAARHGGGVERKDAEPPERRRHAALMDAKRKPFDQRRLARARLTEDQRLVLAPATEDFADAQHLGVASDERIKLPSCRCRAQIARAPLQVLFLSAQALRPGLVRLHRLSLILRLVSRIAPGNPVG